MNSYNELSKNQKDENKICYGISIALALALALPAFVMSIISIVNMESSTNTYSPAVYWEKSQHKMNMSGVFSCKGYSVYINKKMQDTTKSHPQDFVSNEFELDINVDQINDAGFTFDVTGETSALCVLHNNADFSCREYASSDGTLSEVAHGAVLDSNTLNLAVLSTSEQSTLTTYSSPRLTRHCARNTNQPRPLLLMIEKGI